MAVGMAIDQGYDHPHFTIVRQQVIEANAPAASGVDFCVFRCRTKAIMKYLHVKCISAPSVASGQLEITHNASNQKVFTVSATSLFAVGYSCTYTCVSSNTLTTITDQYAIQLASTEKGKWSVLYEYQVVPA